MQFHSFERVKDFMERGVLSYTGILLHLPCFIENENAEQAFSLIPNEWKDKFISDVTSFDPAKEWRNTEHPDGLPPANYSRGMAILRSYFNAQSGC